MTSEEMERFLQERQNSGEDALMDELTRMTREQERTGDLSRPQKTSNLGDLGGNLGFFLGGAGSEAKGLFQTDL